MEEDGKKIGMQWPETGRNGPQQTAVLQNDDDDNDEHNVNSWS